MTTERLSKPSTEKIESNKLRVAWIVEYLFAIGHVLWATKCLSGKTIYIKATGRREWKYYMKQIIFLNLRAASALHLVKNRVYLRYMKHQLLFVKMKHLLLKLHSFKE